MLLEYASAAIEALESIARRKPTALHSISKHHIRWPAFIGNKEFFDARNHLLLSTLKLGEKSPLSHKWNPKSPATFTAYSMLYWLLENQASLELPPLSRSSRKVWFEAGWAGFSAALQSRPEKYIYLRTTVEEHAPKESARKQEKRNLETVIRAKMKDAVRQSFQSVTRNFPL